MKGSTDSMLWRTLTRKANTQNNLMTTADTLVEEGNVAWRSTKRKRDEPEDDDNDLPFDVEDDEDEPITPRVTIQ